MNGNETGRQITLARAPVSDSPIESEASPRRETPTVARRSRLGRLVRARPWWALAGALLVGCVGFWIFFDAVNRRSADARYRAAVAAADRLDPGWREGIGPSANDPIPDEQNSANLVVSSSEKIPRGWRSATDPWPQRLDPAQPLRPELATNLRQRRNEATEAIATARALADRPRGRFPDWSIDLLHAVPVPVQQIEAVVHLLQVDALVRVEDKDLLGAAVNVKGVINAGRAIGDQPRLAFQIARTRASVAAVTMLERVLAHGELPESVLAELQTLLEDEAQHPVALVALRGDRAASEKQFELVYTGRAGAASLLESPGTARLGLVYTARAIRENQTRALEDGTQLVELAKLPPDQQGPAFRAYEERFHGEWNRANILNRIFTLPFYENGRIPAVTGRSQSQHHMSINIAILALASERFRQAHGRWPGSPAELVPGYLSAVPYDPYAGGPLRFKQLQNRVFIYSVGPDGVDSGATNLQGSLARSALDVGVELDEPANRAGRSGRER